MDAREALRDITGVNLGEDPKEWQEWWEEWNADDADWADFRGFSYIGV